jgi:hypothetical protein
MAGRISAPGQTLADAWTLAADQESARFPDSVASRIRRQRDDPRFRPKRLLGLRTAGGAKGRTGSQDRGIRWLGTKADYRSARSHAAPAQGRKRVELGDKTFTYGSSHYLLASVALPVVARVMEASEQLMSIQGLDAGSAAVAVGYESASQFTREYKRCFGQTPMRDARRLHSAQSASAGWR